MQKIKLFMPVLTLVLMLGLSNAAYAQLSCDVASTPVSRATETGLTEPAGDINFNCNQGPTPLAAATTITIDYGVPITNNTTYPAALTGIRISGATGTFALAGQTPSISAVVGVGVLNTIGQLVVTIPAQAAGPAAGAPGSFTISGVLLAIAGSAKTRVEAQISAAPGGVLITAQQNIATVITTVAPGIRALPAFLALAAGTTTGTVLTAGNVLTNTSIPGSAAGFSIVVTENYIDMFRSLAQFNSGNATNGVQLLFAFTGIPAGTNISGCTATITSGSPLTVTTGGAAGTITTAAPTVIVEFGGTAITGPSLTAVDTVTLTCTTFTVTSTATPPFAAGNIAATVTLAPTGAAFSTATPPLVLVAASTGQIPRYLASPVPTPALNVITILSATTHMLFPFVAIGGGFDTGFAIANTTADPYGVASGGARPQSGGVTFYFYPSVIPSTATQATFLPWTCTTVSPAPAGQFTCNRGGGLNSTGTIDSGRSWIVLGSEMFQQITGAPTTFNGYAFAIANFSNGHATVFVADAAFSGKFTAGGPALILTNPSLFARTGTTESLGH